MCSLKEEALARDNYSYKKFQKELAKKKKTEVKKQRKLDKKNLEGKCAASAADPGQASHEDIAAV